MRMRINELKYHNIREFDDLNIPLYSDDQDYESILIQMPNGIGKTTSMDLIRYALSGDVSSLTEDNIKNFKSKRADDGFFQIKFTIDDILYYIKMDFDYINGKINFFTSCVREKKSGGEEKGHILPQYIKSILKLEFIRYFVFDGEVASEILDKNKHETEKAIKTLYSLDRIDLINVIISNLKEVKRSRSKNTATSLDRLQKLQANIDKARLQLKTLNDIREKLLEEMEGSYKKYKEIEEQLIHIENNDRSSEYKKIIDDLDLIINEIKSNTSQILYQCSNPICISPIINSRLQSLSKVMTSLKLPKTTSKQFFEDLMNEEYCICGCPLNNERIENIKIKMSEYLAEDETGVINQIRSSLSDIGEVESIDNNLNRAIELRKGYIKNSKNKAELELYLQQLCIDSRDLSKLVEEKNASESKYNDSKNKLAILDEKDPDEIDNYRLTWQDNIYLCTEKIDELNKKYDDSLGVTTYMRKADILSCILNDVLNNSLTKIKEYIKDKTNVNIKNLLNRSDIIIDSIDNYIKIMNREKVSQGQQLAIAYSFLSSMFEEANQDLPFVVDSPAGALDLEVRKEVSELIPSMFKQFIVFVTSGEREAFADTFYGKINNKFYTIWRNNDGHIQINDSLDFFIKFQSEKGG